MLVAWYIFVIVAAIGYVISFIGSEIIPALKF